MILHAHISSGGWKIGPLVAKVQRHSLMPLTWSSNHSKSYCLGKQLRCLYLTWSLKSLNECILVISFLHKSAQYLQAICFIKKMPDLLWKCMHMLSCLPGRSIFLSKAIQPMVVWSLSVTFHQAYIYVHFSCASELIKILILKDRFLPLSLVSMNRSKNVIFSAKF
jgi:hypothetical protein